MDWDVEFVRGDAASFHAREPQVAERPQLSWFEITRPALVLGSTQNESVVDLEACSAHGVELVRRHSGGGAVLLVPGEVVWFDVVIPRTHHHWHEDVSRAAWWLGDAVRAAIGDSLLEVHRGPLVRTQWSDLVCFAGLGPGEVTRGGRKVLGLSQRRTRGWARFQCAVYSAWEPALLAELLVPPAPRPGELEPLVAPAALDHDRLLRALQG